MCIELIRVGYNPFEKQKYLLIMELAICNLMEASPLGVPKEQFQIQNHQVLSHGGVVLFMLIWALIFTRKVIREASIVSQDMSKYMVSQFLSVLCCGKLLNVHSVAENKRGNYFCKKSFCILNGDGFL